MMNKVALDGLAIIPYTYVDGVPTFRDSQIANLFTKAMEQGLDDTWFFDGTIEDEKHFVTIMKSPQNFLHVVYYNEQLVGMFFLNHVDQTHCFFHWGFFKEMWGNPIIYDIGKECIRYTLSNYGFEVLMGITPSFNRMATRYLRNLGLKESIEIPNVLYRAKTKCAVPGRIFFITKEIVENAFQVP